MGLYFSREARSVRENNRQEDITDQKSGSRDMAVKWSIQGIRNRVSREFRVYRLVLRHDRTPWITRVLLGAALAYALSPIDLIPDWIPVLGHLDDVIIVPLLVWLAVRFVPSAVIEECRTFTGGS